MPPKRTSKRTTKSTPSKRAKKQNDDKEASPTFPSVAELAQRCLDNDDAATRRQALQEAVEKGYRQSVVWPAMKVEYAAAQKATKKKRNQEAWFQVCVLAATLLSYEFRQGNPKDIQLFATEIGEDKPITGHWLETLCDDNTNGTDAATVAHVLDILLATLRPSSPLYSTLLAQLGGAQIYHFLPDHRKELEDRKGKLEKPSQGPTSSSPPVLLGFVDNLLKQLEATEQEETKENEKNDTASESDTLFVHRCLELVIDVLSVWETRQYLVPYLEAIHFRIKLQRAMATSSPLVRQLADSIISLLQFPLDPYTGQPQTKAERLALYHQRAATLQKMAHRYYGDTLPDVIYSGIGILCSDCKFLRRAVAGLPDADLKEFLCKIKLLAKSGGETVERDFLLEILEEFLIVPPDPLEDLRNYPLYPTESVLWDVNRIPPSRRPRESTTSPVLSLPKLQNSFLSFSDYLVRNFTLTRLETAYAIRTDLVDVIRRLNPVVRHGMNDDDDNPETLTLKTEFSGWARMALELDSPVEIIKVEKPLLGTNYPAAVQAIVKVNLRSCAESLRRDWDSLTEFDNLFLVSINAAKMTGAPATQDGGRPIPEDDDPTFPQRYGVTAVRGCMITQVRDEEDNAISEPGAKAPKGTSRFFRVLLDPHQYSIDSKSKLGTDIYQSFNLVVRRQGRENNFRAILETTRGLLSGNAAISRVLPSWLQPLLLGHGDPSIASYASESVREYATKTVGVADPDSFLDFGDTFIDEGHLCESFPGAEITVDGVKGKGKADRKERRNYKVRVNSSGNKMVVEAQSYEFPRKGNGVRFTPVQVEAVRSGLSCGLTMVVGPPGTGKTDVAVQVIACLYHSYPTQRTVVITHSNAALNDIFEKVMTRGDVDERYMVRLGAGERDLETESTHDFTKTGRVAYSLQRRAQLLEEVQQISESMGLSGKAERGADGAPSYTCETAAIFFENHIKRKLRTFQIKAKDKGLTKAESDVTAIYPFTTYFKESKVTWGSSIKLQEKLDGIFDELAECRPLELLRSQRQKTDYLLIKQARVVAMTCTHAAIARSHLLELGFEYDNLVIEESGQMTEVDTIIPFLLQKSESDTSDLGRSRLKRVCLMGDHHQLPPVIKNQTFSRYSNLDQSLFGRLIGSGVPRIQLDKQGRARSELAQFYRWRYKDLGDLAHVDATPVFQGANAGFAHTFQFINVGDYKGKGETTPTPFYYQNMGEAEYAVALFQYMVLIGHEPSRISILATYNGQKNLIQDVLQQRCGSGTPLEGVRPGAVSTVDQYQGQQNDIILLSLVRTESLGHLRDVRRWVVALSRARLGLYILGRSDLFKAVHDLQPIVNVWDEKPHELELLVGETFPTERAVNDDIPQDDSLFRVENVDQLGAMVYQLQEQLLEQMETEVVEE